MALRAPISLPTANIRDFTKWCKEAIADGNVTTSDLQDNAVTVAKLAQLAAVSLLGNPTNATANVSGIAAATNDRVLARTANVLSFVQLTAGMFPAAVVPDAALSSAVALITSSAYTGTLTGCATAPTLSVDYRLVGGVVALNFSSALTAVSNTVACTITGAPAAIRPGVSRRMLAIITDNSVTALGTATMDSAGTLTLNTGLSSGAFTAAGTKGIQIMTLVYAL